MPVWAPSSVMFQHGLLIHFCISEVSSSASVVLLYSSVSVSVCLNFYLLTAPGRLPALPVLTDLSDLTDLTVLTAPAHLNVLDAPACLKPLTA